MMPASEAPPCAVDDAAAGMQVHGVDAVGLTVSDLDRALGFYCGVLDFERTVVADVADDAFGQLHGMANARVRRARLQLGHEAIELTEYISPPGRLVPPDSRSQDRWFQHIAIIVSDMALAYERLCEHGVNPVSTAPQRLPDWNANAGGIEAFYFRDPDDHTLEILRFPAGKGAARWQRADGRLFLGIDHTAIVVQDTASSLRFYRALLGLEVAGESENWGPEQERLNNVAGARLRITSLQGAVGPGIELLEYLSPRNGRPYPADARANDLIHWQTRLLVADADVAERRLRERRTPFVSPGVVAVPGHTRGVNRGLLMRDPDGHAMEIMER